MNKTLVKSGLALAFAFCCGSVFAQGDGTQYAINVGSASAAGGDTVTIEVRVDNTGPMALNLQGWSYGVCGASDMGGVDVVDGSVATGSDAATLNGGGALGFESLADFGGGWTQGVVIDLFGINSLAAGSNIQAATADYDLEGPAGTYPLVICDTLGTPPVAAVVVEGGASLTPNFGDGAINILSPNFVTAQDATGVLSDGSVDSDITLRNVGDVAALQVALTYDSAIVTPTAAVAVGPAAGAEFFEVQPGSPAGELAIGLVMDFDAPSGDTAPIPDSGGADVTIITLTWTIDPGAPTPTNVPLSFADGIGSPAVNNLLINTSGGTETPNLVDGRLNIVNFNPFLRGDCNFDTQVDIADGIYGLNFLFQGGPDPVCDDACDFNDDGTIDSTDAIQTFNYVLGLPVGMEPPPPPAPGPFTPGVDPTTGDGIGCNGDADD